MNPVFFLLLLLLLPALVGGWVTPPPLRPQAFRLAAMYQGDGVALQPRVAVGNRYVFFSFPTVDQADRSLAATGSIWAVRQTTGTATQIGSPQSTPFGFGTDVAAEGDMLFVSDTRAGNASLVTFHIAQANQNNFAWIQTDLLNSSASGYAPASMADVDIAISRIDDSTQYWFLALLRNTNASNAGQVVVLSWNFDGSTLTEETPVVLDTGCLSGTAGFTARGGWMVVYTHVRSATLSSDCGRIYQFARATGLQWAEQPSLRLDGGQQRLGFAQAVTAGKPVGAPGVRYLLVASYDGLNGPTVYNADDPGSGPLASLPFGPAPTGTHLTALEIDGYHGTVLVANGESPYPAEQTVGLMMPDEAGTYYHVLRTDGTVPRCEQFASTNNQYEPCLGASSSIDHSSNSTFVSLQFATTACCPVITAGVREWVVLTYRTWT